jgi:alginate O-acetyltransferase complex protein AlgI
VLILSGLFKKVVLADGIAPFVNECFNRPQGRGAVPLAFAAVGFSIQIYGDFAGYTDIARGIARVFGIELARNFEQPYLSRNITDFWRTWHMSLSTWLHDYLYVPLGGNRGSQLITYRNLMITMLLGGLWHGASWHFVVWGALHGVALAVHRSRRSATGATRSTPTVDDTLAIVGTFTLVTVFWVFFRAASLSDAFDFFGAMTKSLTGPSAGAWKPAAILIVLFGAITFAIDYVDRSRRKTRPLQTWPMWLQGALAGAAVVALIVWSGAAPQPFIYFQF